VNGPRALSALWSVAVALGAAAAQEAVPVQEAVSADGRWRVRGEAAQVVVFDRDRPVRTLPSRSLQGGESAAVRQVQHLPARRSFVIAFHAPMRELWELSVDPDAAPVFDGMVHDHRMGEAIASPGFLGVRRTPLERPVDALAADAAGGPFVLARSAGEWLLINLDVRRAIARYPRLQGD
jgi:hypothetical protein